MKTAELSPCQPLPIGAFLCSAGLVSPQHVEEAVRIQRATGEKLGAALVRRGALDAKDAQAALMVQERLRASLVAGGASGASAQSRPLPECLRLGELLVARGEVLRAELDRALQQQAQSAHKLGDVLVRMGAITAAQLAKALHLQTSLLAAVLAAGLGFAIALAPVQAEAAGGGSGAKLHISVNIQKSARVSVISHPDRLQITHEDIARGYVDLPQHSLLAIRSNSADGFALEFHGVDASGPIREVEVSGGGRAMRMGAGGGVMMLAGVNQPGVTQSVDLAYRVHLSRSAQPGTYAWPMTLTAMGV